MPRDRPDRMCHRGSRRDNFAATRTAMSRHLTDPACLSAREPGEFGLRGSTPVVRGERLTVGANRFRWDA
jgi:hypothetical protein